MMCSGCARARVSTVREARAHSEGTTAGHRHERAHLQQLRGIQEEEDIQEPVLRPGMQEERGAH